MTLALALLAAVAAAAVEVRLGEHGFDWTTVEEDRAHFRWSAEVINETSQALEMTVTVDLLDDDDAVVHSDSVSTSVQPQSTQQVEHDGSLLFDRAADVVSFRFRLDPVTPTGR